MDPKERRRAPRSRTERVLELYEPEGRLVIGIGRLLDLSALGFRFEGPAGMCPGQMFRARIRLEKNLLLEVPVKVAWTRGKGTRSAYGMEFNGIAKADLEKMQKWIEERNPF